MTSLPAPDLGRLGPAGGRDRFVAFAFAAADLLLELHPDGRIAFAAGAFRSRLDCPAEDWVGRDVEEIVAPEDRAALQLALSLLVARGRLAPLALRLAGPARTPLALAGLALPGDSGQPRVWLTFSSLPAPVDEAPVPHAAPHDFARRAEALMRATRGRAGGGDAGEGDAGGGDPTPVLGLLQVDAAAAADQITPALQASAPSATVGRLAEGRYGLLPGADGAIDLVAVAAGLETALRARGVEAAVAATAVPMSQDGLSPAQAARALRHALNVFARGGADAVSDAGFDGGLTGAVAATCARFQGLRRVIEERRFRLVFQPIVALATGAPHHHEALMRPQAAPGAPAVPPQEFVSDIETSGLAEDFDLAVAEMSREAASESGLPVAFNLSALSMQSPTFRARLMALLDARPLKDGLLLAEMTETADVEDLAEIRQTVQRLRERGVRFCLDDFGAGATALQTLRALPVDYVKLDGAYVRGVARPGRDRAFVAAMVDLAGAVGAATVAEHVETEEQAQALRELGIGYGQGWLFGRPGPLPRAEPTPGVEPSPGARTPGAATPPRTVLAPRVDTAWAAIRRESVPYTPMHERG